MEEVRSSSIIDMESFNIQKKSCDLKRDSTPLATESISHELDDKNLEIVDYISES
jgi:hypothetical protein